MIAVSLNAPSWREFNHLDALLVDALGSNRARLARLRRTLEYRRVIEEREIWACAAEVIRQHQDRTPHFIAERLGALAVAGDLEGIRVWRRIAAKANLLSDFSSARPGDVH